MELEAGKDYYICPECHGAGFVKRSEAAWRELPYSDDILCQRCQGRGVVLDPLIFSRMMTELL